MDVSFKFDPSINQLKDINLNMNIKTETAKRIYENDKEYLSTAPQVLSVLKTVGNFFGKVTSDMINNQETLINQRKIHCNRCFVQEQTNQMEMLV